MKNLLLYSQKDLNSVLKPRSGETKLGEQIQIISDYTNIYDAILEMDVDYVIFGICEDIGVIANYGIPGTYKAWDAAIKVLLNTQSNTFIDANRIMILGHLDYNEQLQAVKNNNLNRETQVELARKYTETIDADVSELVFQIVKAGKIPIIIGGGHNNAYGNIKGTSKALSKSINVINFDAHHDFRALEGRHSGNGFSYAEDDGYLKNYYIFGLHENYCSQNSLDTLNTKENIRYRTFESIAIHNEIDFFEAINDGLNHVSNDAFGIEIDCDAIENVPSSAMTPSGFTATQARQFINKVGESKNVKYLHICEAAPTQETETQLGKLISYLITDLIKANGR